MDPGFRHLRDAANGTGQLPLQGPLVIETLHEIGGAQPLAVKEFEAYAAAPGHAFAGQVKAHLIDVGFGHQDGTACALQFIGDFLTLKLAGNGRGVIRGQVGKQYPIIRAGTHISPKYQRHDSGSDSQAGHQALGARQGLIPLSQVQEQFSHRIHPFPRERLITCCWH